MPVSFPNFHLICNSLNCFHNRCNQCYDLDSQLEVVGFCSGALVDLVKYVEWYAGFGGSCRVNLPPGDTFHGITSGGGEWRMTFRDGKLVARPEWGGR